MDRESKRRQKITIMGIIGVVMLLIGTSFAVFTANITGTKEQTANSGCLRVQMSDNGALSLSEEYPTKDEAGLEKNPYTYTLTNTCSVDAFYTSTLNIENSSNEDNLEKVKIALNGDTYLKPTFISDLTEIDSVDDSETNLLKTYKIDEGVLGVGESKTFNLRSWIDYNVEEFTGSLDTKVIVKTEARGNNIVKYDTNTTGYTVLKTNTIIKNAAYNLISPSANQTSGIVKVEDKFYYRGNPTNNYISFAGKTWRILSTNNDGSINIVLNTTEGSTTYGNVTTALNSFYSSISSEEDYIKTTNTFCEDNSYEANNRLENSKPADTCDSNNYMTKIGLLSVDDLMYAGGVYNETNSDFYLASSTKYWTNTWKTSSEVYNYQNTFSTSTTNASLGLKPVITLKANTLLEGEGTSTNPYYVSGTYDTPETTTAEQTDTSTPTIIYARVDDKWSNENKYIEISANDKETDITGYYIGTSNTKPNASASGWESSSALKYTSVNAYDNGTYYAFAKDENGNVSDGKQVVISKVDKTNPTCVINIEPDETYPEYKTLKVTAADTSGIDPNGYSWTLSDSKNDVAKVDVNGEYTATVTDMAGNKGTCNITVDGIDDKTGYEVSIITENGVVDTPRKYITKDEDATFNLTPNNENDIPIVTCTNNQLATITNNVLTIKNVSSPTTCTISYDEANTVLYEDGTLIINELARDSSNNIEKHGAVTNTYNPFSNSDSYVMSDSEDQPWHNEYYDITDVEIGSNISPTSTAYWFYNLTNMKSGDFTKLNTSNVTNMNSMFYHAGYDATTFDIGDLSNWDVSNVTNMYSMFYYAGYSATTFELDLSNWNVSSVTDMSWMFGDAGYDATTFELDLSNWNASNVTNMYSMFYFAGQNATTFELDLSNWNASNVTNMNSMFYGAGYSATTFELDLSNWNVSNVTNMESMFYCAGYSATTWSIGDLSNWDVSNVTNMSAMFMWAGESATTFELDLSNWDVSNVTNMSAMFDSAGESATTFELDLSNWDVSNVTNMSAMFYGAGSSARNAELYITNWNPTSVNVTSYMFNDSGFKTIYCNYDWNNLSNITESTDMFSGTTNLVGGNNTAYNSSNPKDKTYARPDVSGTPGYFTKITAATTLISKVGQSGLTKITHEADNTLQIGATSALDEYRYVGSNSTVTNNYVTFNNETYRIIGVFPTDDGTGKIENRIKLIKAESIGNKSWNENYTNNWTEATLNTYLNGTFYNSLDSASKNLIDNAKYYLGGYRDSKMTKDVMYTYERKTSGSDYYYSSNPTNWTGKIGLMYASDYGYGASSECTQTLYDYDNTTCKNNDWLYLGSLEWLLPQNAAGSTHAFYVYSDGYGSSNGYNVGYNQDAVRPVLYLISAAQITGGDGTSGNPYTFGLYS